VDVLPRQHGLGGSCCFPWMGVGTAWFTHGVTPLSRVTSTPFSVEGLHAHTKIEFPLGVVSVE
jgi:hypothetical protein